MPGSLLLDFIRYTKGLTGTKIGCREGDCGACSVLVGELKDEQLRYRSYTSCLTPIGNVHGKHVVTIEGVNLESLNKVQQCMADSSATQCGFCTPGFIMSFTGFCLAAKESTLQHAISAIDGNICRCTGYKSIERAASQLVELMESRKDADLVQFLCLHKILPEYFLQIPGKLKTLSQQLQHRRGGNTTSSFIGGGTDLYVQRPEEMQSAEIDFLAGEGSFSGIKTEGNRCIIESAATVTDLLESQIIKRYFPRFNNYAQLISSTPIRNMATVAGNFINASPIGDLTIFFLALDAQVLLTNGENQRELPLRQLYKGYKTLDKGAEEYISSIAFELPASTARFNFEKVSKRTHLDIASVNSAIKIDAVDGFLGEVHISAGGVGPIPKYLENTSSFLTNQPVSWNLVLEAVAVAQSEITPISDARGSADYKRLLLGQLLKAHFVTLFPDLSFQKMLAQ